MIRDADGHPSRRWFVGLPVFAALLSLPLAHLALYQDRAWALVGLVGFALAFGGIVKRRPWLSAGAVIATSVFLQLAYINVGYSDQVDLGRSAVERVVAGQSPYGVIYDNRAGGSNPFGYGPLALLTAIGGTQLELIASALLLMTIAWTRSWITLCVVAGFPPYIFQAATGLNDYSVSLTLTLGWLMLRSRPPVGMVLLAAAAAMKPYVVAWFPAAVGYAGWSAGLWLAGASLAFWWPVVIWGIGTFVESLRLLALATAPLGWASNTIPLPWVRILAIPVALAGLFVRHWTTAILVGSMAFVMVLFFGEWASLGYWVAVLPISGIALESLVTSRSGEASGTTDLSTRPANP